MATAPTPKTPKTYRPPISSKLAASHIQKFMTRKVIYASPSTTVEVAMKMMLMHKISGLVIVDQTEACLGVYSEMDAMLQGASQALEKPIRYTKPALTLRPETPFREALILMAKKRVKRLIISDSRNKLVGVVSRRDLMRAIFDDAQEHKQE